ncbi:hypothetical protein L580_0349 [Serratia fonticola AU-P3(3)]|nr:hypothetical protein L580_0349 [Serratia fonticola AU-P3(3)]
MQALLNIIKNKRTHVMGYFIGFSSEVLIQDVYLDCEHHVTPYEEGVEKDYFIECVHDLAESFEYLIDAKMIDYGVKTDGGYNRKISSNVDKELSLSLVEVYNKTGRVLLEGSLCTTLDTQGFWVVEAVFHVKGLRHDASKDYEIHQELILEAESLCDRSNLKMGFFVYFSALEAVISKHIDTYKSKIHSELFDHLERLSLDEKVKLVVKECTGINDFNLIKTWGEIFSRLKRVKEKRNKIAHAKKVTIHNEDVEDVLFVLICFTALINHGASTFGDVRKLLPK